LFLLKVKGQESINVEKLGSFSFFKSEDYPSIAVPNATKLLDIMIRTTFPEVGETIMTL